MRPILFHFGPFPVFAYGTMILIGFLIGMFVAKARFRAKGINPDIVYDVGFIAMLSGILGARIFYLVQYRNEPGFDWRIFNITQDLSVPGIFIGLLIFIAFYKNLNIFNKIFIPFVFVMLGRYKNWFQPGTDISNIVDFSLLVIIIFFAFKNFKNFFSNVKELTTKYKIITALLGIVSIIVGMKALHCYIYYYNYRWDIFMIWRGGLVFYGGFVLGVISIMYFLKKKNLPILKVCDALTPSLALGLAFTRFGCFLNGCCYGGTCSSEFPFKVSYPPNSLVGQNLNLKGVNIFYLWETYVPLSVRNSIKHPDLSLFKEYLPEDLYLRLFEPVYPTQIFSSILGILIFIMLTAFYKHRKHDGELILMFGIIYSVGRFSVEILRNDTPFVFGTGFHIAQVVSIFLFIFCSAIFIYLRGKDYLVKTNKVLN